MFRPSYVILFSKNFQVWLRLLYNYKSRFVNKGRQYLIFDHRQRRPFLNDLFKTKTINSPIYKWLNFFRLNWK